MSLKLQAEIRTTRTRSAVRQLRQAGKVPAVVYGKRTEPLSLTLDKKAVLQALKQPSAWLELELPEQPLRRVVIQEVQRNPVNQSVEAIDFHQVDLAEPIKTHVPIVPIPAPDGKPVPCQIQLHELHVQGLPDQIPSGIGLDLSLLRQGHPVHVKELPVPDGLRVLNRPDEVVASPIFPAVGASAAAEND